MKKVIMKNLLFWMVLIVGIVALIGSCSKKEESTTDAADAADAATTAASSPCGNYTAVSSCSGTPSGSITGIDNQTLTGVFSTFHVFGIQGVSGFDNATDCVSNSDIITSMSGNTGKPTGAVGLIFNYAVTSSSTFAQRYKWYSDTSCSTEIAQVIYGHTDVAVGDNVTGRTTSVGSNTYSSTATKVTYNFSCFGFKGSNAAGVTWIKTLLEAVNPVVGTSHTCSNTSSPKFALMHVDNTSLGGYGTGLFWETSSSAQPTDWSSSTDTLTFLP
jgi:hypothetical protein